MAMKLVLLNMPIRQTDSPNNVPLGIYYLIARIREKYGEKVTCDVIDLNLDRPFLSTDEALERIAKAGIFGVDAFLLSGLITTYSWIEWSVAAIRWIYPESKIVVGGGVASNVPELMDNLDVDSVCEGEGDETILDIVSDLASGKLQRRYPAKPPRYLDDLPWPAWEEVQGIEVYLGNPIWGPGCNNSSWTPFKMVRSLNMISSRGCPYSCKFCNKDITGGRNYRCRHSHQIAQEIAFLKKTFNIDFIGFVDDNLAADAVRLPELCDQLRNLGIKWGCHARFDNVDDIATLRIMKEAGCEYIGFGGESANPEILRKMKKRNKPTQMARVLRMCRDVGIHPNCTWIMGWPGETRQQLRDTTSFILRHAPENRKLFTATAYPHTELFDEVQDQIIDEYDGMLSYVRELGDATKPVMNYSAMGHEEWNEVRALADAGRLEEI